MSVTGLKLSLNHTTRGAHRDQILCDYPTGQQPVIIDDHCRTRSPPLNTFILRDVTEHGATRALCQQAVWIRSDIRPVLHSLYNRPSCIHSTHALHTQLYNTEKRSTQLLNTVCSRCVTQWLQLAASAARLQPNPQTLTTAQPAGHRVRVWTTLPS